MRSNRNGVGFGPGQTTVWTGALLHAGCVNLGKVLWTSELQLPSVQNGDNSTVWLTGVLWELKGKMNIRPLTQCHGPSKHTVCSLLSLSGPCWRNHKTWLHNNDHYAVRYEPRLREHSFSHILRQVSILFYRELVGTLELSSTQASAGDPDGRFHSAVLQALKQRLFSEQRALWGRATPPWCLV